MVSKQERDSVGLPPRIIFYTIDQIGTMLELKPETVKRTLLFFEGRDPGICPKTKMRAVNIMPEGETPEWRISERILLGYLRSRGIKFYSRGYIL